MDGDPRLSCRRFRLRSSVFLFLGSSVAASACTRLSQSRVVVVARIADEAPNGAQEFVIVAETGVAVRAQSKLELGALLVALLFREVHDGRGLFLLFVVGVLGFKHRFVTGRD
jgi:hypothetical protein